MVSFTVMPIDAEDFIAAFYTSHICFSLRDTIFVTWLSLGYLVFFLFWEILNVYFQ